ncbi:MAG: diguanylate cyclase [Lachnospiraceae bacterium]|nr:diguanylate cyclase [Lachnospiraceae bacterium]
MDKQKLLETIEELRKQLAFMQEKYQLVITNMDCAIWEYDCETHFLHQEKKLGGKYEDDNLDIPDYRNTIRSWGIVHPEDVAIFEAYCDSMDNGDESYSYEFRTLTDDETYTWQRYEGNTIRDEKGNIIKIIGKTLNVDREYKAREALKMESRKDALTGLLNKGVFEEEMAKFFSRYQRGLASEHHAIYMMDIDNFKGINDTYGHIFGDYVLEQYARQLKAVFQEQALVGRIGGDEFAVLKKKIVSRPEAEKYAKQLNKKVREMELKNGAKITTSIGIAIFPADGQEFRGVFRAADIALYDVKNNGKDGYAFYNEADEYTVKKRGTVSIGRAETPKQGLTKEEQESHYRELENQVNELLKEKYYYKQLSSDDFYYYVMERDYRLVFESMGKTDNPVFCYQQYGLKKPCKDCLVPYMNNHDKRYSVEYYDKESKRWFSKTVVRLKGREGQIQYVICREDVTRLLGKRNAIDKLTNLSTIEYFETETLKLISENPEVYCMVFLGFKNFDAICRKFGYKAADEILKMVGKQLNYSLVEGETAARIQGRDFLLLLKKDMPVFDRVHMIMKVLQHECEMVYAGIFAYMESGVYNMESEWIFLAEAIDFADYARQSLCGLKKRRRNEIAFFDETLQEQYRKENVICRNMYQAFFDEEFKLYFLPKVEDGKVKEVRLLTKWEDKKGGIKEQEEYIPVFQKKDFMIEFNLNIYEKAFSYLQQWKREGKQIPVVNLDMTDNSLWDPAIFDKLSDLMERYGIQYKEVRIVIDRERFVEDNFNIEGLSDCLKKRGFFVVLTDEKDIQDKNSREFISPEDLGKLLEKE